MPNILKILRSLTPGNRPTGRTYGELYANLGDNQLGVFDSSNVARDLLGVPMFSPSRTYATGNPVNYLGLLYIANQAVPAGVWDPTKWTQIGIAGGGFTTGDAKLTYKTVADPGWVFANDGSIGDAVSGATTRANADTQNLFNLFWTSLTRTSSGNTAQITVGAPAVIGFSSALPITVGMRLVFSTTGSLPTGITAGTSYYVTAVNVSGSYAPWNCNISATPGGANINTSGTQSGTHTFTSYWELTVQNASGTVIGRGASAAADFAAHNRLVIPKALGRALAVGNTYGGPAGAGLTVRNVGDAVGAETVSQSQANLATHYHPTSTGGTIITIFGANTSYIDQNLNNLPMGTATTVNVGSGTPMPIMQPTSFLNVMICL